MMPFSVFAVTQVNASVDKNPVMDGEYVTLTITANDNVSADALDTNGLKKDFDIGRTSVARSTQMINFDTTKETRWQVLISPKKIGMLQIPAFTVDGVSSNPIKLKVVSRGNQSQQARHAKNIFIKTSLSTKQAYVGQLILYKVKLYLAADLQRGVLNAPKVEGANIKQIGADQDSTEIENGKRYRVIERTYGITANLPGELSIGSVNFTGDVLVEQSSNIGSGFGGSIFGFNESRPVQSRSVAHSILINPLPANYKGDGLVADLVMLQDKIADNQKFEVGVPITRTVTLLASNAEDTSIPDFAIPVPEGFKVYPEKPVRDTIVREGHLVGRLVETVAIVPSKAGEFTLPEISVPWWNPHLKKQQTAVIKAVKINVQPAAETAETPIVTPVKLSDKQTNGVSTSSVWPWLTLLFAILWLVTLVLWRKTVTNVKTTNVKSPIIKTSKKQGLAMIVDASQQKDAGKVLMALQSYFSEMNSSPMTIDKIALISTELKLLIVELQKAQYSKNSHDINFAGIPNRIQRLTLSKMGKNNASSLTSLNP